MSLSLTRRAETWRVYFQTDCGHRGADAGHEVPMGAEHAAWGGKWGLERGARDTTLKSQGVDSPGEVALPCLLPRTLGRGVRGRPVQYRGGRGGLGSGAVQPGMAPCLMQG